MTRLYSVHSVLSNPLIYCQLHIKNKTEYVQKNILSMLCIFLIGFLIGNLFGTILKLFQNWEVWDGLIILGLITKIEVISYFSYKSNRANALLRRSMAKSYTFGVRKVCVTQRNAIQQKLALQNNRYKFDRVFWTNLNLFKIGIMVGFFVDAFKVGS